MNYYREHQAEFLETLKAFLRIPSISTLSEHKPDIRRAAEFAGHEARQIGMPVQIAIAHAAAVQNQALVQQASVPVLRRLQLLQKICQQLDVIRIDLRLLDDQIRIVPVV